MTPVNLQLGKSGTGSRVGATLFLSVFGLMGSAFLIFMIWAVAKSAAVRLWPPVECRIERSVMLTPPGHDGYGFAVTYVYRDDTGQERRSEKLGGASDPNSLQEARRLAERYPVGAKEVCYVNPEDWSEAVLVRDFPWLMLPFMLIPLVFVAIGFGGIWFTWRKERPPSPATPVKKTLAQTGNLAMWITFTLFFLIGAGVLVPLGILPVKRAVASRQWPEVPCRVISSRVESHSDSDGTTYSIDILYEYEFGGRTYQANRYDLMVSGSSSGYQGKKEVVERYPAGARTVCRVNPDDPEFAVLRHGFSPSMLFALIPLVFMLIGLGGIVVMLRRRVAAAKFASSGRNPDPIPGHGPGHDAYDPRALETCYRTATDAAGGATMMTAGSPWLKLLGAVLVALFWNGIVAVFVGVAVDGWRRGRPEWFLMVFLIPFVTVGLVMVGAVVHCFLAAFNPRPRLRLGGPLRPGAKTPLHWEISGWANRIRELTIRLEGCEAAIEKGHESSTWRRQCFCRIPVVRTDEPLQMHSGHMDLELSAATLPGWSTENHRLEWRLHLHGRIDRWPDLDVEFPVTVLPVETPGRDAASFTVADAPPESAMLLPAGTELQAGFVAGRANFAPGETVSGIARWRLPNTPRTLELRLFWFADDTNADDVKLIAATPLPVRPTGAVEFSLALPNGPFSCRGTHVHLQWAIELVAQGGVDAASRQEFTLAPDRAEISLGVAPKEEGFALRLES